VRVTNWKTYTDQFNGSTGALTRANANAYSVRREITPYVGAVWDFHPNVSAYASYADIFKPQNLYDANDNLLKPVVGKNHEMGLKGEFLDRKLNASLAVFRMVQDNLGELDPDYPDDYLTPGGNRPYRSAGKGVTTRGFEAEVSGALSRGWNISAGYTYAKSKKADGDPYNPNLPEHLLRVFTTYRFQDDLSGLTLGLGGSWNSAIWAVAQRPTGAYRANGQPVTAAYEARQGAVLLLNAMARYQFTPQLSLMVNVDNLLDRKYYNTMGTTAYYGTPRRWRAALRYQF
jgi:outer membrane receptor for ferric coprogen and ferric-rhodotorulic acid